MPSPVRADRRSVPSGSGGKVALVVQDDARRAGGVLHKPFIFRCQGDGSVQHHQRHICTGDGLTGTVDADLLDLFCAVTQPRRIAQIDLDS